MLNLTNEKALHADKDVIRVKALIVNKQVGVGFGIRNMRSLIEQINAKLNVNAVSGNGVVVSFELQL